MTELEKELRAILIKIILRHPDALKRIETAVIDVLEVGVDMNVIQDKDSVIH